MTIRTRTAPRAATAALVVAAIVLAVACSPKSADTPVDSASPDSTVAAGTGAVQVMAPDQSYMLELPARWRGLFRTDTLTTAERGAARPPVLNVVYLPTDTTIIPQTLVVVAVYDSAAWVSARSADGPSLGDSLMARNGRVYVLGVSKSNPFPPGSVDALKFDSLALTPVDMATLIKVP